ncbi:MAG: FMN-binding protein [Lachnospiraceae bacterium]|nr:FMN-binding protein [Lachnospiraceae bacterium]
MKSLIKKRKVVVISLLCVVLALGSYTTYYFHGLMSYRTKVSEIVIENIDISNIPDGLYIGECDVGYIYAKVNVMVKNGEISTIDLAEHRNDRGATAESIIGDILVQQRIDVDAVSGATNSSSVIKKAVMNALSEP